MKSACLCGTTVYELNGNKVIMHDLDTGKKEANEMKNETEAEYYYTLLTFNANRR